MIHIANVRLQILSGGSSSTIFQRRPVPGAIRLSGVIRLNIDSMFVTVTK